MSFCTWFGAIAGATLSHFNVIFFHFPNFKIVKPQTTYLDYFESVVSYDYFLKSLNLLSCTFIGAFGGLVTEMTWNVSFPTFSVFLISYFASSNLFISKIQSLYVKCIKATTNTKEDSKEELQKKELDLQNHNDYKVDDLVDTLVDDLVDDLVDPTTHSQNSQNSQNQNSDTQSIESLIEKSEKFVKSQTSTTEATLGISRRKKIDSMF